MARLESSGQKTKKIRRPTQASQVDGALLQSDRQQDTKICSQRVWHPLQQGRVSFSETFLEWFLSRVVVSIIVLFSPLFGENSHFDIFSKGLKPPTSKSWATWYYTRGISETKWSKRWGIYVEGWTLDSLKLEKRSRCFFAYSEMVLFFGERYLLSSSWWLLLWCWFSCWRWCWRGNSSLLSMVELISRGIWCVAEAM